MRQGLALVRAELWARRMSLAGWAIGVAALVGIDMLLYKSVKGQAAELNHALRTMPAAVRALFANGADFLTPVGFLSARVYYVLLPLLLSIFTIRLGAGLIGKEESRGTLELLLARPVSRTKLLISKLLAGAVATAILGAVALVTALVCLRPSGFSDISYHAVIITTVHAVLLCSLFGMVAFALTAIGAPVQRSASGIAVLFAFASYIMASLESIISWLSPPAKLLPYHYYQPNSILSGASTQLKPLLGFTICIIALALVAWLGFRRRDI